MSAFPFRALLILTPVVSAAAKNSHTASTQEHLKIQHDANATSLVGTSMGTTVSQRFANAWIKVESYNPAIRFRGALMALEHRAHQEPDSDTVVTSTISSWVVSVLIFLLAALIYKKNMAIPERDMESFLASNNFKGEDFKHGVFSCLDEPKLSLCACFCGCVPWADSMDVLGFLGFWIAVLILIGVSLLDTLTGGISWFFAAAMFTYFRQQIRKKFEMKNETADVAKDYLLWLCCPCCSTVQEARQTREMPAKLAMPESGKETEVA